MHIFEISQFSNSIKNFFASIAFRYLFWSMTPFVGYILQAPALDR